MRHHIQMPWNCACPTKLLPVLAARNQGDDTRRQGASSRFEFCLERILCCYRPPCILPTDSRAWDVAQLQWHIKSRSGDRDLLFFRPRSYQGCCSKAGLLPRNPARARTTATTCCEHSKRVDGVQISQAGDGCQTGHQEKGQQRSPVAASHCAGDEAVLSRPPCSSAPVHRNMGSRHVVRPGHDSAGGSRADRLSRGSICRWGGTRCRRCRLVGSPTRRDGSQARRRHRMGAVDGDDDDDTGLYPPPSPST